MTEVPRFFQAPGSPLPLAALLLLAGCVTADFKVVDALRFGMTADEARATIASFSFERESALERPDSGWPAADGSFTDLAGRARAREVKLQVIIQRAEYYPVHHGLLGFGQLFLFYDDRGRLVDFYRHQIN
jgi:hypothetical protein